MNINYYEINVSLEINHLISTRQTTLQNAAYSKGSLALLLQRNAASLTTCPCTLLHPLHIVLAELNARFKNGPFEQVHNCPDSVF